jgi:hypothetical protein
MRVLRGVPLILGLGLTICGCGPTKSFKGPTVDAFTGRLVHDGQPVAFPEGEQILLEMYHETGEKNLIPIHADGSFKIGWMPIGKHGAALLRSNKEERGPRTTRYSVPGGVTIEAGKTDYTIELGKGWKP